MLPIPPIIVWVAGAAAAIGLARLAAREWQRVNATLRAQRAQAPRPDAAREAIPTLRRDPRTGIYRVER